MEKKRLIDADALGKKIDKMPFYVNKDRENVLCEILSAPTIEAEPVRHGRWVDPEDDDDGTEWHCSECGSVVETLGWYPRVRFCHNCGARMDKEEL